MTPAQSAGLEQRARELLAQVMGVTVEYLGAPEPDAYVTEEQAFRAIVAALPHMQPADWPPCPECGAGVLFECPACSASNYPEQPADEAMVKRACNAYDLAANPSSDPAEYPAMHAALRVALMSMMI